MSPKKTKKRKTIKKTCPEIVPKDTENAVLTTVTEIFRWLDEKFSLNVRKLKKYSFFLSSKFSQGHVAASFEISAEKWTNKFCSMSGKTIDEHNLSKKYVFPQELPMKL